MRKKVKATKTTQRMRRSRAGQHAERVPIRVATRSVPVAVQCMLWAKAAGRCEFSGCNRPLWKSPVTQELVNVSQKAHIYSFASGGPRGNRGVSSRNLNDLVNLMLVCHPCHRKIDAQQDGGRYTAELLRLMKSEHEERIERVTGIASDKRSHVVLYGANVGNHGAPLSFMGAAPSLFPHRYPAAGTAIELSTINSSFSDRDANFWSIESENLKRKFSRQIKAPVDNREVEHLSVFALAPQPLLILLGTLLGDIVPADVYQRQREPPTWEWPAATATSPFEVRTPTSSTGGVPALVLALSATVTSDRIVSVLGPGASIWTVTVPVPHNDMLKSREQLSQLRALLRPLLDQIKASHGQTTPLHVFPVGPVSAAIELGRIRMPKADMPWQIYDQVNALGGFIPALSIAQGA